MYEKERLQQNLFLNVSLSRRHFELIGTGCCCNISDLQQLLTSFKIEKACSLLG